METVVITEAPLTIMSICWLPGTDLLLYNPRFVAKLEIIAQVELQACT